jgi:hypothetical protein
MQTNEVRIGASRRPWWRTIRRRLKGRKKQVNKVTTVVFIIWFAVLLVAFLFLSRM